MERGKTMSAKDNNKQFVWFNSYTLAVMSVPEGQQRDRLIAAIVLYAATGMEPDFAESEWALRGIFEAVRPNVESSRACYENSNKPPKDGKRRRGRPKKEAAVVDDVDQFAATTEIPDEVLEAMAETAEMEVEVW